MQTFEIVVSYPNLVTSTTSRKARKAQQPQSAYLRSWRVRAHNEEEARALVNPEYGTITSVTLSTQEFRAADYASDFDNDSQKARDYRAEQYTKAAAMAAEPEAVFYLSDRDCWSATYLSSRGSRVSVSAYERLGYHTGTYPIMQAWLDAERPIVKYLGSAN